MSLRPIDIWMSVGDPGADLSVREMIRRLLGDWIAIAFEPSSLSGLWNGETVQRAELSGDHWETVPLWRGEVDTGGPLTIIESLEPRLRLQLPAACDGSDVGFRLGGPLLHRPPLPGTKTAWYGRAKLPAWKGAPACLLDLVLISLEWSAISHHVVIKFPLSGYPVAAVSPVLADGEPIGRAPCPEIVEENRRSLFGWIAALPYALDLPAHAVEWEINADAALLDDDVESLRAWERWLREDSRKET